MAHTDVWDETAPNGATVDANTLDTIIQALKIDIRERMNDLGSSNFGTSDPVGYTFLRLMGATPYIIGGATHLVEFRLIDETTVVGYITNAGVLTFTAAAISALSVAALTVTGQSLFQDNIVVGGAQAAITPFNAGNSGVAIALDWDNGNNQIVTLTGAAAITLLHPVAGSVYLIKLLQDATGARQPTWPASVHWAGGAFPGCTGTPVHSDLFSLYYDGANYLGAASGFNFNV